MNEYLLGETQATVSTEEQLVQSVFEIDPTQLGDSGLNEYENLVKIVEQFTRVNPDSGEKECISPSRIAAIPAITARHIRLVEPARGVLNSGQVSEIWFANMPENTGDRHPDLLFDIAQYNFGTDEPVDDIVRAINRSEIRRQELIEREQSRLRRAAAIYRNEQALDDDASQEAISDAVDKMLGRG